MSCRINPRNTNISGSLWRNRRKRKIQWARGCGSHEREAHAQRLVFPSLPLPCRRGHKSADRQKNLNQCSVLRVQEPLEIKDTSAEKVFSCSFLPPYRHSLPLLQDSFSAELGLLLRGRKVLKVKKEKNNKSPIRNGSASNEFKSPNNSLLQTSGVWQHLDDLPREQEKRCVPIWKSVLNSEGSLKITNPSFLPSLPTCLPLFPS